MKETELNPHECVIGLWYEYDNTDIVTERELFNEIRSENNYREIYGGTPLDATDYCDFRKSVNLARFRHCPMCGKKIDWKTIKRRADNEQREAEEKA